MLPNGHEHALGWDPALARIGPSAISSADGRGFVLALGSRARHKNLQLLMNIAPEIAAMGLDVVIAGGGAGIFTDEVLPSLPNVKMIGHVPSSYFSPTLGHSIALALLDGGLRRMGETVTVVLPDRAVLAMIGKSRFYDLEGERLHG